MPLSLLFEQVLFLIVLLDEEFRTMPLPLFSQMLFSIVLLDEEFR